MYVKNFCCHFGRRCLLNRSLVIVVTAVAASFLVNYWFTTFILSRCKPCLVGAQKYDCSHSQSAKLYADLALSADDLKDLITHINTDVTLKERYAVQLNERIAALNNEIMSLQQEKAAEESKLSVVQKNVQLLEAKVKALEANYTPQLLPPFRALVSSDSPVIINRKVNDGGCSLLSCFDFSRCSLFSSLNVFLYNGSTLFDKVGMYQPVTNRSEACVFFYVKEASFSPEHLLYLSESNNLNHVIVRNGDYDVMPVPPTLMVGAVSFSGGSFRKGFDFLLPYISSCLPSSMTKPALLPIKRHATISFVEFSSTTDPLSRKALSHLKSIKPIAGDTLLSVRVSTVTNREQCQDRTQRLIYFKNATFSVILNDRMSFEFGVVFSEVLQSNSIPVVLYSKDDFELPLSDVIDWSKTAILLPSYRVSEIYYLLKSLSVSEIASYKLEGRRIFEQFFSSTKSVLLGVFASLTRRLHLPPPSLPDLEVKSAYFPNKFAPTVPMESAPFIEDGVEISMDEYLGPAELPRASETFCCNFTEALFTGNYLFSAPTSPFQQFPFPHDIALKAFDSLDFRPVGQGLGGSGRQLGLALGGNQPAEQFTIVLLTRGEDRLPILVDIVSRFKNLPYLNKVIIVWNDELKNPPADLKWPELIVPIFVAKMDNNSLNNRFLPMSEIETDAVLSLDDDMFLRPDEIVFAFRVWRENRDRIVGFPSRSHGWNSTSHRWIYVSDYSCEYSLVLTGAAFIHKYYLYVFTLLMPAPIRETVDELMNCEDIAMNFLVSHLTRKPPLKVTVRWTFHCPTCKTHLWKEQTHFDERSECIQRFTEIYGYNPLLFSQSRADSVLFKTRVPSTHQKCFKYV